MRRPLGFSVLVLCLAACAPEGPTGFVSFNVPPDTSCTVSPSSMKFLPFGIFDIAPSPSGPGGACEKSYVVNLLVNSYLRSNLDEELGRAEPNILQVHSAEVKLMTLQKRVFEFEAEPGTGAARHNPFLVTTNNSLVPSTGTSPSMGIASVEAIPSNYTDSLVDFVGTQILAEIQVFGTTTGDLDIEFKPFVYPIKLCDGCLKLCLSDLVDLELTPEDIQMEECPDNAGADGRECIDPSC